MIKEIVDQIPYVLKYFMPGYVFLSFFIWLDDYSSLKDRRKESVFLLTSVAVSSIFIGINGLICSIVGIAIQLPPWAQMFGYVLIAVPAAIMLHKIKVSTSLNSMLQKIFQKETGDNIWKRVLDLESGNLVKIYMKDENIWYVGHIYSLEEKGKDSYLALINYLCHNIDDDSEYDSVEREVPSVIVVNLVDVRKVEVFYSLQTKKRVRQMSDVYNRKE
jgi:hypothetical protein